MYGQAQAHDLLCGCLWGPYLGLKKVSVAAYALYELLDESCWVRPAQGGPKAYVRQNFIFRSSGALSGLLAYLQLKSRPKIGV